MKDKITFEQFLSISNQLEIKMGKVMTAVRVPKTDKLIKLSVRFGESEKEEDLKTIVTNLGEKYEPEAFDGAFLPFITNLAPRKMGGVISEGMIMVGVATMDQYKGDVEVFDHDYSVGTEFLV